MKNDQIQHMIEELREEMELIDLTILDFERLQRSRTNPDHNSLLNLAGAVAGNRRNGMPPPSRERRPGKGSTISGRTTKAPKTVRAEAARRFPLALQAQHGAYKVTGHPAP